MSSFKDFLYRYRSLKAYVKWIFNGKPSPPPHIVKQNEIRKYKRRYGLDIFIESGTFMGEMVNAQKKYFAKIISIELSNDLYVNAVKRFNGSQNIEILFGDSGKIIGDIIPKLTKPALFWLDGHYSGGNTAKSDIETPIMDELAFIFQSKLHHVILIDDARLFIGKNDYPTLISLQSFAQSFQYQLSVKHDIICLTKIGVNIR